MSSRDPGGTGGAASPDDPVRDFQRRLDHLDETLGTELRARRGKRPATRESQTSVLRRIEQAWRSAGLGDVLERLDRLRTVEEETDAFGLDPELDALVAPVLEFLYRRWWRVRTDGIGRIPATGPAALVANHSGGLFPWDGLMVRTALRLDHPARRDLRPLLERSTLEMPLVNSFLVRTGSARADPDLARRLLAAGGAVLFFPEGERGIRKPFSERYRLQTFAGEELLAVAAESGVPILPVAIVGAEEAQPVLGRLGRRARRLGLPDLPITPTFPFLGLLGLVPLPTRWQIRVGEPVAPAERTPGDLVEACRMALETMIRDLLRERASVF